MTSAFKQHNIPWKRFFFFIYICRITEFTVIPNTKHGLQSREPRPQLQRGFLTWWSGCSPIYCCTPTRLHISNSLTHFTFISGKNQEVLVFSSWRGAHYNVHIIHLSLQPHIQHQLHALRAHNHTEARTLQWHCIGFATDFIVAGLHIVLGKGVIINQNLFWLTKLVTWHSTHEFKATRAYTRKK